MQIQEILLSRIKPNPNQPREEFSQESLEELAASIKEQGLVQPIVVRPVGDHYEIVAGERRWRACRMAKMEKIPAIIREVKNEDALLESFLENTNREDLNPIERENAVAEMMKITALNEIELGKKLGKKESDAARFVRTHLEAKKVRDHFHVPATVSTQHLFEIGQIPNKDDQKALIQRVISEELSVHKMRPFLQTLKKAPASLRSAVIKGDIPVERVKAALSTIDDVKKDTGKDIPEAKIAQYVEQLKKDIEFEKRQDSIRKEIHRNVLGGKKEGAGIEIEFSAGQAFLSEIEDAEFKVKGWSVPNIMLLTEPQFAKAKKLWGSMRDHLEWILGQKIKEARGG
jgi:ParB family chromosome partitioning protein